MNRVRTLAALPVALPLVLASASVGCFEDARSAPMISRDLLRATGWAPPAVPMRPRRFDSQADFDAFEGEHLGSVSTDQVVAMYETLAAGAEPATRPADALLVQRLVLLHLASGGAEQLRRAFAAADRPREEAPDSPHTIYLLAHVKRLLLEYGARDHTFRLAARNRDVAERLRRDWSRLLSVAPDYLGPRGDSAVKVAARLGAIEAALAVIPAEDPKAATTAPLGRPAGQALSTARRDLLRFETSPRAERVAMCADPRQTGDRAASEIERLLGLRCAVALGDGSRALAALTSFEGGLADADRWRWVARISANTNDGRGGAVEGLAEAVKACAK